MTARDLDGEAVPGRVDLGGIAARPRREDRTGAHRLGARESRAEPRGDLLRYTANTNYVDTLTSEQSLLSAQIEDVNDRLQRLQAVVTLYRALGGGWR